MAGGTVGLRGFGNERALELPDGQNAAVSPPGRGRIRYNYATDQFEGSRNGATYEAFATGGAGLAAVADLAALTALDDSAIVDEANVPVASVRDVFELDKSSTLTVDGITIVATASGTGRWIRRQFPSLAWANYSTFHINATIGNDENDGATALTALATWGEYLRRVDDLTIPVAQTISIDSALSEGIYLVRGYHPLGLTILGTLTQSDTGTLTAAQSWSLTVSPVVDGQIADVGKDFSTLLGARLRMLDGAAAGNSCWVLTDSPGGLGVTRARVSKWFKSSTFNTANPSPGDTYEVLSLTTVTGAFVFDTRDAAGNGFVSIQDLHVAAEASAPYSPIVGSSGGVSIVDCRLTSPNGFGSAFSNGVFDMTGALVEYPLEQINLTSTVAYTAWRDGSITVKGSDTLFYGVCPAQRVSGGTNASADQLTVNYHGYARCSSGGFGGCDIATVDQAVLFVDPGSVAETISGTGVFWSVDQATSTWGARVDSTGTLLWPRATSAVSHLRFDDAVAGAEEVQLGGVLTDAVTLAVAGSITAANNAAAIPRST